MGVNDDGLGVVPKHLLSLELLLLACTVELFAQTWSKEAVSQSILDLLVLLVLTNADEPKFNILYPVSWKGGGSNRYLGEYSKVGFCLNQTMATLC